MAALRTNMSLRTFTGFCGFIAFVVGATVVCGWVLDVTALKTVLPGLASMKANTAIGLAAAGAALVLAMRSRTAGGRAAAAGLALLAGLIAPAAFAEHVLNLALGIAPLLFAVPAPPAAKLPGRPSLATAIELALASVALLALLSSGRATWLVLWLASLLGLLIALFALLSYAYGHDTLYSLGPFSSVAIHTGATFLVRSAGLLAWSCQDSLRLPMISLVLLVPAPLTAVMVYFAQAERQDALNADRAHAQALARLLSVEFGEIFAQTDELLLHVVRTYDAD